MKPKSAHYEKLPVDAARSLPIISDAAVATPTISDGRLVPLVIVDTSLRPDVRELIRMHRHVPPGDVTCVWAHSPRSRDAVVLVLHFTRPMDLWTSIEFDIATRGGLVDQIMRARAVYIQAGVEGDRLISTFDHDRIQVEVPATGFDEDWDHMLHASLAKSLRKTTPLDRAAAKRAAREIVAEWRKMGRMRMG